MTTVALKPLHTTASTCCYCGVGCGVLIEHDGQNITGVKGDPQHPANYGRLCTKGLNLAKTVASDAGRLLQPQLRRGREDERQAATWDEALDYTAERFAHIIAEHGPHSVAFYLSGQLLTEDYYVFNKIAKGLIGTNNIDTNSRLCMSSAVVAYKKSLGADGPPTCYEDLELADCVLFAGSNMAYAHPVLFRRLEAAKQARGQKWIVIDPRRTDTAASADLHLQIQPGTDVALFNAMLHHIIWQGWIAPDYMAAHTEGFAALKDLVRDYSPRMAADICGVSADDIMLAASWFAQSPASLSLYCMGLNQSSHGTDKNLALINLHLATQQIGRAGAGPFSLTGQPNAMGGREVGGMATMLAAHRDYGNAQHRADVAAYWQLPPERISDQPGLAAVDMFAAIERGDIKAVYIACTNPAHSMPNLQQVHAALRKAELVVVQDCFDNTETLAFADVALSATGWGEKEGSVTNSERRISRVRAAIPARGQARGDWQIARDFGRALERHLQPAAPSLFAWDDSAAIFAEHAGLSAGMDLDMTGISHSLLESHGPVQWPLPAGASAATHSRRYTDGQFATANGKARFSLTDYQPVAEQTSARYPFHLLTGRLRDQWHGMSRTGRVAGLMQHAPEPQLNMHPKDMALRGLETGQLVRVASKYGELILPLQEDAGLAPGSVFAAMHWGGQFMHSSGINAVLGDAVCEQSQQPELKHVPVRIEPAQLSWRCMLALRVAGDALPWQARLQPWLSKMAYASLTWLADGVLLLKAAHAHSDIEWLQGVMTACDLPALGRSDAQTISYYDGRKGQSKCVAWSSDEAGQQYLRALVFAGSRSDAQTGEHLLDQLAANAVWTGSRLSALNAQAGQSAPRDKVLCNCKGITVAQVQALRQQGKDMAAIQGELGCGTVCGSCVPELKGLCAA